MSLYKLELKDTYDLLIDKNLKLYDHKRCEAFILERGKVVFGSHFMLSSKQSQIFHQLIAYAIEDRDMEVKFNLLPNKGLLLLGGAQTGKTAFMRLIQYFFERRKLYEIKSSRILAQDFSCKGYEAFTPLFDPNAKVLCLDNIGREPIAKHFGSTCDVVYNIVEHFYEQRFDLKYPKLHITSSLTPTELEKRYGRGFRAMLKEMFNTIVCEV